MSSTDYMLTQLAELALRVADLESTIANMKADGDRLTNAMPGKTGNSMNTSIPLTKIGGGFPPVHPPHQRYFAPFQVSEQGHRRYTSERHRTLQPLQPFPLPQQSQQHYAYPHQDGYRSREHAHNRRPFGSAAANQMDRKRDQKQMTIQDVLQANEQVTIRVNKGKDGEGKMIQTTCVTRFDGNNLKVEECELVPSLNGMTTSKPGEILYKFIEGLHQNGHIERVFTTAPWKLCFVERDGQCLSLEQLRAKHV
jgi:hypothetical protein